jgi:hypothetical protein
VLLSLGARGTRRHRPIGEVTTAVRLALDEVDSAAGDLRELVDAASC